MKPASRTLFANGRILTGRGLLTPAPQLVEALLVEDGVIVASGSTKELRAIENAAIVDLEGACCMPGFNDAHLHLGEGARLQRDVDLRGTRSLEEALQRMERRVLAERANNQEAVWLSGGGWDETLWAEKRLPTRHDLDRVTGEHPAVFARIDVHASVANSAALRLARVDRHTVAPDGSAIDHDASGEPTGILREQGARVLVEHLVPSATQAAREQSLRAVLGLACAQGITSVQDNSVDADFAALRALHARSELPLRVSEWLPFDAPVDELKKRQHDAPQDRFLRTGMLKAFLDGSLGSRTAALNSPYTDAAGEIGLTFYEQETLSAMARERVEAGFSLGFHAIGDRAFAMALAAFEFASRSESAANKKPFRSRACPGRTWAFRGWGRVSAHERRWEPLLRSSPATCSAMQRGLSTAWAQSAHPMPTHGGALSRQAYRSRSAPTFRSSPSTRSATCTPRFCLSRRASAPGFPASASRLPRRCMPTPGAARLPRARRPGRACSRLATSRISSCSIATCSTARTMPARFA